jgi:hypothetical protein
MLWHLEPHLSHCCSARVLSCADGVSSLYRCSSCGTEARGNTPAVLCSCGATVGTSKRDAGLRCMSNPKPTPARPSEIEVVSLSRYETQRKKP